MAFGISRIFKSTDASAPQFQLASGQFKDVLKAVLVNGYGSTPSLGWTLEYEVGNVAVFRMKGGTRYYLRLDDTTISTEYATSISGFKTMDTINTGTERVPAIGINPPAFRKRNGGSDNIPWIIIGDDAGIIILHKAKYAGNPTDVLTNVWTPCYFGDYIPFDIKNKWNFCLLSTYDVSGGVAGIHKHVPTNSIGHFIQRDHSFTKGAQYCGVSTYNASAYFGNGQATLTGGLGLSGCMVGGTLYTLPVFLYQNMLGTNTNSSTCLLGALPGIREPIMTDGESKTYIPFANTMDVTFNGPDYSQLLAYVDCAGLYVVWYQQSSKLVFRIGKGFRNV